MSFVIKGGFLNGIPLIRTSEKYFLWCSQNEDRTNTEAPQSKLFAPAAPAKANRDRKPFIHLAGFFNGQYGIPCENRLGLYLTCVTDSAEIIKPMQQCDVLDSQPILTYRPKKTLPFGGTRTVTAAAACQQCILKGLGQCFFLLFDKGNFFHSQKIFACGGRKNT